MTYPDMQAPNLALTAGRIDAVYVDGPTLGYAIKQGGQIELLGEKDLSPVSIGFKKGAGMEKAVQLGMESLAKSGKYKEILDKWGVGTGAITDFAFNKAQ
jgi:polar amino acid transport system substrate-binding protein